MKTMNPLGKKPRGNMEAFSKPILHTRDGRRIPGWGKDSLILLDKFSFNWKKFGFHLKNLNLFGNKQYATASKV